MELGLNEALMHGWYEAAVHFILVFFSQQGRNEKVCVLGKS